MILTKRYDFIPALESARGIAALCVCGLHSLMFWSHFRDSPLGAQPIEFFVGVGNSAVNFFFILSGFVLVRSLGNAKADRWPKTFEIFLISRIFRIYPVVISVVLIFYLIEPWAIFMGMPDRSWASVVRDALLIQSTMDWPSWSARVEIAATPLILACWAIRRKFGVLPLVALCVTLAAFSFAKSLYSADEIGQELFVFVAGAILVDCRGMFRALRPYFAIPIVFAALYVVSRARIWIGWHEQWTIVIETLSLFLVTGCIAYGSIPIRWLDARPLRLFGRISYSFYLVHFVVLFVMIRHLPGSFVDAISFGDGTAACLEVCALDAAASTAIAIGLYYLVELPGIAVGRKLIARRTGSRLTDDSATEATTPAQRMPA